MVLSIMLAALFISPPVKTFSLLLHKGIIAFSAWTIVTRWIDWKVVALVSVTGLYLYTEYSGGQIDLTSFMPVWVSPSDPAACKYVYKWVCQWIKASRDMVNTAS